LHRPPDRFKMPVGAWRARRGVDELSDEQVRVARAAYYGLVTYTDRNIGRILNALVVFAGSDQCEQSICSDQFYNWTVDQAAQMAAMGN